MEVPEPKPVGPCPGEREILDLVRGQLHSQRLEKIVRHTDSCESCALVVAEAGLAITAEAGDLVEQAYSSARGLFAPGQLIASRYRIQDRIGRGGMGEVYSAIDEELGERVALKIIASALGSDPVLVEHFKRELRLARKVSHPNVCKTLEFGRHELEAGLSQCFFTMQFIDGTTLRRRLIQGEPFDLPEALATVRDLALGLQAIHDQSIVHRDIKPDNVMLAPDAEKGASVPLWLDFGVARVDLRESVSRGLLAGTPDYAAPELLEGKVATRASDLYALGLVLHEVLVGDLPFARVGSFSEAAGRPSLGPAAPSLLRADIPAALDELVLECLSASPERRPATALLVAQRLRAIQVALGNDSLTSRGPDSDGLDPEGHIPLPVEPARTRRKARSRGRWLLLAAAGAMAALGAHCALRFAVPEPKAKAREQTVSNAALPSPKQPRPPEPESASPPMPERPTISLPAQTARPKAKRSEGSEKPTRAPSASPHAVSDFGGRR